MRKYLPAFLINPLFITILLFILQLSLFLWITLRPFSISPQDRSYYILRGQGAYTAFIRQAKDGAWQFYNPYTTRPIGSISFHLLYLAVGKIAAVFSIDPVTLYMVLRVFSGLTLFIATYWLIITILPSGLQSLAILFTLGIEPGPLISNIHNLRSLFSAPPAIFSYFPQELALRHFGLPHHVLAEALGLLLLGNLFLCIKKSSGNRLILLGVLTITSALLMPAYASVMVLTMGIVWLIWVYTHGQTNRVFPAFIIIIACLAITGVFTKFQMDAGGYPYKNFNLDEKHWVTDSFLVANYSSSLLLYIPAVAILWASLIHFWHRMTANIKLLTLLMTAWVIGPLFYIPIAHLPIFPFANFRLVDGYAYVPMGILASISIWEIARTTGKRTAILLLLFTLGTSLFFTISFTRQTFEEQKNLWSNVYPLHQEWDAIHFLSTVPKRSGILVMKFLGEIIPSYATVRVFLGETPGYLDWQERFYEASQFYSGQLTNGKAHEFLQKENISYVYWGQDEKKFLKTNALYPSLLLPVFQNPAVTVFVQKQ